MFFICEYYLIKSHDYLTDLLIYMKPRIILFVIAIFLIIGALYMVIQSSRTTSPKTTNERSQINHQVSKENETTEIFSNFDPSSVFLSNVNVTSTSTDISIYSDGLPDHETGEFPNSGNSNSISEQDIERTFTRNPQLANSSTSGKGYEFGIAINGILFEPLTGEFWNNDRNSGWNLEWSTNDLGFDFNNAHVQPDGTYHYHGNPTSLLAAIDGNTQTLLGYAADGFPIYVENLESSYQLKSGTRPDGPGGTYDGTYVEDYEYIEGLGDLDECNGIYGTTPEYPEGIYHYVLTETFPIISRCFSGMPDVSFKKGEGTGMPNDLPPPPPRK